MKSKLIWEDRGERTFALVLQPGEDVLTAVTRFAATNGVQTASLTAIGDFERAELGIFDLRRQTYRQMSLTRPCEALSLRGDIAADGDGRPSVHIHAVIDVAGGATRGGHLLYGVVKSSVEAVLVEAPLRERQLGAPRVAPSLIEVA